MRIVFTISILTILISCGHDKIKSPGGINIETNITRTFDTLIAYPEKKLYKAYDIELSILNKSDKPVSFWMMTCSWAESFIINNDYIKLFGQICDSNFPVIKHLSPHGRINLRGSVIKVDFTRFQSIEATKLGLILIDTIICKDTHDFENIIGDKSKQEIVIWSNPLYLNNRK